LIAHIINKTLDVEPGTYKIKCVMQGQALPAKAVASPIPKAQVTTRLEEAHSPFVEEVIRVFGGKVLEDEVVKG